MDNVNLFELRYSSNIKVCQDDGFIFFDNIEGNVSHLREIVPFYNFVKDNHFSGKEYSGLFSPRFYEKTGLSSLDIRRFIKSNPNHCIYLFHPYPRELIVAKNFLSLAELEHPGISDAINSFWLWKFGCKAPEVNLPDKNFFCCHSNYFVANQFFWSEYKDLIISYYEYIFAHGSYLMTSFSPYSLSRSTDISLPLAVFVFERLLTVFISSFYDCKKVTNYCYATDWDPPEIFQGEDILVAKLATKLSTPLDELDRDIRYSHSVKCYFHYRCLFFVR